MMTDNRQVMAVLGPNVSDDEAAALANWYSNLARGVAAMPEVDLKGIEPPLRSVAGPRGA